jgi:predicted Zn-dependent peptidase
MNRYSKLNEDVYLDHLENGLNVIVIPKKGFIKKYAIYATHFGSIDDQFIIPGETEVTKVPDGVAHFLEHKLFEQQDGINALDKISRLGGSANAYTTFNHTSYLFECTDKFDECFEVLLNFVQNPYLTKENVEKEKGIISQEIQMYNDDPDWQLFFGLINSLFKNHAISKDIAGTVESISKITPEILYKCYNTFYHPSNMAICVVGDVDPEDIINKIKKGVKQVPEKPEIKRIYGNPSEEITEKIIKKKMNVSIPMFSMGFKDVANNELIKSGFNGNPDIIKRQIAIEILLEIIAGESSELFEKLYNEGLITKEFETDYTCEENYAFSSISCEAKNPEEVIERVKQEIVKLKKEKVQIDNFERIKKKIYGQNIEIFNSISKIGTVFISAYFKGMNPLEFIEMNKNINIEYINKILNEHFIFENMGVSIIEI